MRPRNKDKAPWEDRSSERIQGGLTRLIFFFFFKAFSTFIVVSNYFHIRNIETCLRPQPLLEWRIIKKKKKGQFEKLSLRNTTNNTWDKNLAEGQAHAQHMRSFPHSIYSYMSVAHVY